MTLLLPFRLSHERGVPSKRLLDICKLDNYSLENSKVILLLLSLDKAARVFVLHKH